MPGNDGNRCDECDMAFPNAERFAKHRAAVHPSAANAGGNAPDPREMGSSRPRGDESTHRAEHTPPRAEAGPASSGRPPATTPGEPTDANTDPVQDRNGRSPDLPGSRPRPEATSPAVNPSVGDRPWEKPAKETPPKTWESSGQPRPEQGDLTGRDDHRPPPGDHDRSDASKNRGSTGPPSQGPGATKRISKPNEHPDDRPAPSGGGSRPSRNRYDRDRMDSEGPGHPKPAPLAAEGGTGNRAHRDVPDTKDE